MNTKQFFDKYIDGYLIKDIQKLSEIKLSKNEKYGGCGYPLVMTILAGMELIGHIISNEEFKTIKQYDKELDPSFKAFSNYWNKILVIENSKYKGFENAFRSLLRNGLMHTYLSKPNILIHKNHALGHLDIKFDKKTNSRFLVIDIEKLATDFINSYRRNIRVVVDNPKENTIKYNNYVKRINEIMDVFKSDSKSEFSKFNHIIPTPFKGLSGASGMSEEQAKYFNKSSVTISGTITTTLEDKIKNI